jgi:hypothetical protein
MVDEAADEEKRSEEDATVPGGRLPQEPVTPMPRRKVADILASLEKEFATASSAFVQGEYALWLGSGISRDVVPDVSQLLRDLLCFLQQRVDATDDHCRFAAALREILEVGGLSATLRESIDFAQPVECWPRLPELIEGLRDKYSAVLDVRIDGEDPDFLVWAGINAASTYGAPDLLPDVEHLCIAILMLEGVVRFVPTTNWDGLVEAAVSQLAALPDALLRVVVLPGDFSSPEKPAELVKFHGCAVRALEDEAGYRDRLIARESQISGWASKPDNRIIKERLEFILATRPAFVVGLSAQDANIHTMFNQASQNLERTWPAVPPAMVCATEQLGGHHKHMLKVVYGDAAYSAHRTSIEASALLGAYAKPALLALVLHVLTDKLCMLLTQVNDLGLSVPEIGRLQDDIRSLRDAVSTTADADVHSFTDRLIATMRMLLSVFRTGERPAASARHYEPLTVKPVREALGDPNFPGYAFGRLAAVLALLRRGHQAAAWVTRLETGATPEEPAIRITSASGQTSDVFVVKDAAVLAALEASGQVDMSSSDVLVIYAEPMLERLTRSPRTHYGRTGARGAREVDFAALGKTATTADELFDSFKLAGAL